MKIFFIGGGNMAEAMVAGMTVSGYKPDNIIVFDRNVDKSQHLSNKYGIKISSKINEEIRQADIIVLAVKPQGMADLIKDIKDLVTAKQIIVTVAAGIETKAYEKLFSKKIAFVRTIPNTPATLGYGATGIYFNSNVAEDKKNIIIDIMQTMGKVVVVDDEKEIDIIAAIASSGPAYYFQFMEHMVNAAVKKGLDKTKAEKLVIQTCLGAAQMALYSDKGISTLRKNITSKNGITYEALKSFEMARFGDIVDNAICANIDRSEELSKEFAKTI